MEIEKITNDQVIEIIKKFAIAPNTEMRIDGFILDLDINYEAGNISYIVRKDKNLLSIIEQIISEGFFPVVDKTSSLVFAAQRCSHPCIMAMLNEAFISEEDARFHDDQDNYIFNGLGYFVSSMNTRRIIVSGSYKKDRFDDPIFASFSQASSHR